MHFALQGINAKLAFNIKYDQSDEAADFVVVNSQSGIISTRLSILSRELRNISASTLYPFNFYNKKEKVLSKVQKNHSFFFLSSLVDFRGCH